MTSSVSRIVACGIALFGAVVLCTSFVSQASAAVGGGLLVIRCDKVCDKGCKNRGATKCSRRGGCSTSTTDECRPGEPCDGSYCTADTFGNEDCWCYK